MKSVSIILLFVVVSLTLVSCNEDGNVIGASTESNIPVVQETQDNYIARTGGEMSIAIPDAVSSWNPIIAVNEDIINMLSLVYETPLSINSDGRFSPNLIETWSCDDSGKIYTFTARKGIKFHNGDDLTADDILYSITKIYDAVGGSVVIDNYNSAEPQISEEETDLTAPASSAGNYETNRYARYNDIISSISKIDDYTIQLTMSKPGREALYFMTFPVISPSTDANSTLNGTGAYYFSEKNDEGEYVFLVNQNWWKTAPYIERIVARPVSDFDTKLSDFDSGLLTFITTNSIASNKQKAEGETQIVDYNTNYYDCIIPNLFNGALKDINVRKAISYAIDRRQIITSVMQNHAVAAEIPISPSFYAYDVKYKLYEYDPAESRELLAESGYVVPEDSEQSALELTMIVPDEVGYEYRGEVVRVIADQLAEVGITCNIELLSADDYLAKLENSHYDLAYCSYYADNNPDLTFMLGTGQPGNYGNVASSELDEILSECSNAVTEDEVVTSYAALQQYFIDKVPQIGLFYRMFSVIADYDIKDISGMHENRVFANISTWSIDFE